MRIAWRVACGLVVLAAAVLLVVDTLAHGLDGGVVFALGAVIVVFGWDLGRLLWRRVRDDLV